MKEGGRQTIRRISTSLRQITFVTIAPFPTDFKPILRISVIWYTTGLHLSATAAKPKARSYVCDGGIGTYAVYRANTHEER